MPRTDVHFYQAGDGSVPVRDWLLKMRKRDRKAYEKCVRAVERLQELGHELRRPETDNLRDDIHELRARRGRVNYRILYFFHGNNAALLVHGLTKEQQVPPAEIDRAVERKLHFQREPTAHTAKLEYDDGHHPHHHKRR